MYIHLKTTEERKNYVIKCVAYDLVFTNKKDYLDGCKIRKNFLKDVRTLIVKTFPDIVANLTYKATCSDNKLQFHKIRSEFDTVMFFFDRINYKESLSVRSTESLLFNILRSMRKIAYLVNDNDRVYYVDRIIESFHNVDSYQSCTILDNRLSHIIS